MKQKDQCRACTSVLWFATDGMGRVVERCPHCDEGWPLRVTVPARVDCEHGENPRACEKCERKRQAIRDGVAEHMKRKNRCRNGHPYTPENMRRRPNGRRACMACYRNNEQIGNARRRAQRQQARRAA